MYALKTRMTEHTIGNNEKAQGGSGADRVEASLMFERHWTLDGYPSTHNNVGLHKQIWNNEKAQHFHPWSKLQKSSNNFYILKCSG